MMSHTYSIRGAGWLVIVEGEGGGGRMARGGSADRAPDWESKLNAYRSQCKVKGGWAVLYERSECAFTYQPPLTFHWLLYAFNCQ